MFARSYGAEHIDMHLFHRTDLQAKVDCSKILLMQAVFERLIEIHHLPQYARAVLMGAFIWGVQSFWISGSDITPFTLAILGVGVTLAFGMVVEAYHVAACRDGAIMLDRLMADVVFSVSVMVPVTLVLWTGVDAFQQRMFGLICGVIVMTLLLQLNPRARPARAISAQYQDDPEYFSPLTWLLRLWPLIYCALWLGFATDAPLSEWSETYLLSQLIVYPFTVYRLHPRRGLWFTDNSPPAFVGIALVLLFMLAALTGYLPTRSA